MLDDDFEQVMVVGEFVEKDHLLWQMKMRVSLQYLPRCRPEQGQVVVVCGELESIDDVELDEDVD